MVSNISQSILLVDDDGGFRSVVVELLASRGLAVVEARSAKEASSILNLGNPAMAVVDYRLPDVDGMTWVTRVREAGKSFPIVFVSGVWFDERTFNWLRNILRVSLILRKPIAPELFLQQVESLLPHQMMLKQVSPVNPLINQVYENHAAEETLEGVDEKIELTDNDPTVLDQLRHVRSKLEREGKIAAARANYANGLATLWQELSQAVAITQKEPENPEAKNAAVQIAHKIRGTAGSIGFMKVGEAAGKIEDLLRGLDPTDTLREVIWTEIFRALADGETAVRNSLERVKEPSANAEGPTASKVLLLGNESLYAAKLNGLKTDWPVEIELSESAAGALQKSKRMAFDAAILDLQIIGKEKLFELVKEIREVPGHEALPVCLVSPDLNVLSRAELAYLGCSKMLLRPPSKEEVELALDKLLFCRQLQKPRVLTVDDDEVLTKFISTILSAEGMLVRPLNKPIVIMETVEQFKPVLAEELIARTKAQIQVATSLRRKPAKDQATGALTSDDFMSAAKNRLEESKENNEPLTFCLISIDDFVHLIFAHKWSSAQGALAALSRLIHSRLKAEDLRGRLGEDTFALVFSGEKQKTIEEVMKRILAEFVDMKLLSETIGSFKTTFSIGLAEYPGDGATVEDLLNIANQRLLTGRLQRRGVLTSGSAS